MKSSSAPLPSAGFTQCIPHPVNMAFTRRASPSSAAAGLITVEASKFTFEKILVAADTMERFVAETKKGLNAAEAKAALNAKGTQFEQLVKLGYIKADVEDETGAFSFINRFSPSEIEEFLRKLKGAVTCKDDGSLVDLQQTRKRAICSFGEVVELLFGGKLTGSNRVLRAWSRCHPGGCR